MSTVFQERQASGPDIPAAEPGRPRLATLRCLIVGAGEAGRAIARDLRRTPEFGLEPVAFLDDDLKKTAVLDLPVVGGTRDLAGLAVKYAVDVVIVAIPSLAAAEMRTLVEAAASAGVSVRYLPSFVAALERDARMSDLRRLKVDSLLGRPEMRVVRVDSRSVVEGRRVLVTGAGGSIGSELCRQVRGFGPERLYFLDHDESNLHRLQLETTGEALLNSEELLIADIRDGDRMRQIFRDLRPDLIFHAAAHKHLPLLERHPCEGVKSNVLGTRHVVEAAIENGAERFILISTDKAADPTSILGATKRLAEMVLQGYAGMGTKLASVRFGNVLGSRGSFLSVLAEQFENGDEITITDPAVTRFFMTIPEAVGLVIEAATMADRGETFVLDMGDPVRIVDLVHNYAAQFHVPPEALRIRFTGLRPGEKLNEALFSEQEECFPTAHPKIFATRPRSVAAGFTYLMNRLTRAAMANHKAEVMACLAGLLPEYSPSVAPESPYEPATPYPDGF